METTPIIDVLLSSSEEKEKVLSLTYKKLKTLDMLSVASSFLGLIVFQFETNYYYEQISYQEPSIIGIVDDLQNPIVISYKEEDENYQNFIYRVILLASTCFLSSENFFYLLILRARTYLFYLKITNRIEIGASYYSSGILLTLMMEIIFNFLISFPKYNAIFALNQQGYPLYYSFDQLTSLAQMGRVYILVRMWCQYSVWNKDASILICNACNTDGGVIFSLKSEFKNNPVLFVGVLFSLTILILGFASRTSERSFSYVSGLNWDYVWNGMWMIIIIVTTVGYGDFYSRTYLGRVFVFFTCSFGPFLISMVNVSISNYMGFSKEESIAYEKIKNHEDKKKCADLASDCIKISWKYWAHVNLKTQLAFTSQSQKKFAHVFNRYKNIFLKFHQQRLQVNTAGFNKPFSEALPIYVSRIEQEVEDRIENYTQVMTNINLLLEKTYNYRDLIEIKMKEAYYKYEKFIEFLNYHPLHKIKFSHFKASLTPKCLPIILESFPLNLTDFTSIDSIKEILSKERLESQQSVMSLQSPMSSKSAKRVKKAGVGSMVEINDILKHLTKKRKDVKEKQEEDSPGRRPNKIRPNLKKSTMAPGKRDDLEIIQEEENKENIRKEGDISGSIRDPSKPKRTPTFLLDDEQKNKEIDVDSADFKMPHRMSAKKAKSHQKIRRLRSREEEKKEVKNKAVVAEEGQTNNEANISVNFSSQMPGSIPFNMSVNVNANPIFNVTTNYNSTNFPFIINVESKNMEKNPNYPDRNTFIEEVKSNKSSFKMDDSHPKFERTETSSNNNGPNILPSNINNTNNNTNNNNVINNNMNYNTIVGSLGNVNSNTNSSNTPNNNNNNLFRQRKIVIEHSMLITESFIDPPKKENTNKESNRSSTNNLKDPKPPENNKSQTNDNMEINENSNLIQNLTGVD